MTPAPRVILPEVSLWIEGEPVSGAGEEFPLFNPTDGNQLSSYRCATAAQVQASVDSAQRAFPGWQSMEALHRSSLLRAISDAIDEENEYLAQIESLTTGKPIRDSRIEVAKCAEMFTHYSGVPGQIMGQTIPVSRPWFAFTERVPLGVIAIFTPWNAPLFTACWNIAAVLACGNTVVVKPSEYTPVSTLALVRIMEGAGLPRGVVNVVVGAGRESGDALARGSGVSKVVFIGSVPVGRAVASTAASLGVPSVLELGGKSANIVFGDADLESAARGAVTAVFGNNGQSCTAGSRLLVEESVFSSVIDRVAEFTNRLRVGVPADVATELGPISHKLQWESIRASIDNAVHSGAVVHATREVDPSLPSGGFWIMPTVLGDENPASPIFTTEIFGPVLAVSSFSSETEAVAQANGIGFGLAGAVWSGRTDRAIRVARQLKAGTVWINSYRALSVAVPFGGFGLSGWGRSSGPDAIAEYTQSRAVWMTEDTYPGSFPSSLPDGDSEAGCEGSR
jgi:aldehyde dehydrogenase (NAD+)